MAKRIIFILSIFTASLFLVNNANAFNLGDPQQVYIYPTNPTKSQVRFGNSERDFYPTEMVAGYNTFQFDIDLQSPGFVYNTQYQLYDLTNIISSGNYLIPLTIQYQQKNLSSALEYRAPGSNGSILLTTCVDTATHAYINSSTGVADLTCTYLIYVHNYNNNNEMTVNLQPMISFQSPGMNIRFSKNVGIIPVTSSSGGGGGGSADISDIKNRVAALLAESYVSTDVQRAILQAIQNQSSSLETALENALESHDDIQQEKYEDQADETEQTINNDSSAAQGTATSLLSVVGQFIGVLTSAQPTNCNIDASLIPHLPLGNLNLCTHSPPPVITIIGSLLLIAFVVPLAYYTVKRMLALIGSFQS